MLWYVQQDFQGEQAWEKENIVSVGGVNIFVLLFFPNSNNFYSHLFLSLDINYRKYLFFDTNLWQAQWKKL